MVAETGKIMEIAIRYTPKADRELIRAQVTKDVQFRFDNNQSDAGYIYETKDNKEWFSPGEFKDKWYLIQKWRVPLAVWMAYVRTLSKDLEDYTKTLQRRLTEALARRGLTAKTWLQIGRSIGADVKAPGYVQNAAIPDGIGRGRVEVGEKSVTVSGENSSKMMIKTGTGQGIVDRAARARLKFLETAIRKGALDTQKSRLRAFPHLFRDAG
jgi:hypothetical protein